MKQHITVETTASNATLHIIEEMNAYVGNTWAEIAHEIVETITSACKQADVIVFDGKTFPCRDVQAKFEGLEKHRRNGRFEWRKYYAANQTWAMTPEVDDLFRGFRGWPDNSWLALNLGRVGALRYDEEKGELVSISPNTIARDRETSYQRALDLSPASLTHGQVEGLLEFGPRCHWQLDHISPNTLEDLPGNPIRPGKVLRQIWPQLSNAEIEYLADKFSDHLRRSAAALDVRIIGLVEAYNRPQGGFVSCMKKRGHYYQDLLQYLEVEPSVAAILEGETVVARAILWPNVCISHNIHLKLMDRIYYSTSLQLAALQKWGRRNGWFYKASQSTHSDRAISPADEEISLKGSFVRLAKELTVGCWTYAPYLDSFRATAIGSDRIHIWSSYDELELNQTDGYCGLLTSAPDCEWCGSPATTEMTGFWLCNECYNHAENCSNCGEFYDGRKGCHTEDCGIICAECWQNSGWICCCCRENFTSSTKATEVEYRSSDENSGQYCPQCLEDVEPRQRCAIGSCGCVIPDSPTEYCNFHQTQIYYTCNNCGTLSPRENEIVIDLPHKHLHLCSHCKSSLDKYNYLDPLGVYRCTSCGKLRANRPDDRATITGIEIYCPDCLHTMQAPDDWTEAMPPRIVRPQHRPATAPAPRDFSRTRLIEICRLYQTNPNAATLQTRLRDFTNCRDNCDALRFFDVHAGASKAARMFPHLCKLSHHGSTNTWTLRFDMGDHVISLYYKIWIDSFYGNRSLMCGITVV